MSEQQVTEEQAKRPGRLRAMLTTILVLLVLTVVATAAILVWQVDDWGRDLTTNVASTHSQSDDLALHPVRATCPLDEAAAAVMQAVSRLPRWTGGETSRDEDAVRLEFVRTTPLMRYKDDVTVLVESDGEGSVVSATSRSRVGRGDLGQNPRNLKELIRAVRQELGAQALDPQPPGSLPDEPDELDGFERFEG